MVCGIVCSCCQSNKLKKLSRTHVEKSLEWVNVIKCLTCGCEFKVHRVDTVLKKGNK